MFALGGWGTGPLFSGWYGYSEPRTAIYLNEQNTPHTPTHTHSKTKQTITTNQPGQQQAGKAFPFPSLWTSGV